MLIKTTDNGFIHSVPSEITPRQAYSNRRQMIRSLAAGAAGAVATAAVCTGAAALAAGAALARTRYA